MNNGKMIDKINIKCGVGEGSDRLCQSHVKLSVVRSLHCIISPVKP
ncbi:MAG TPA: hypothetical protein VE944_21675 [Nostoc sp.]|nr:hypothetical protein [Nostoc sp.]HYX16911.1 hypothetical protein [Nostoc sp.]